MVNVNHQGRRIVGFAVMQVSNKSSFLGPLCTSILMCEEDTDDK